MAPISRRRLATISLAIHAARHKGEPWKGSIGGVRVEVDYEPKREEFSIWMPLKAGGSTLGDGSPLPGGATLSGGQTVSDLVDALSRLA